MADIKQTQDHRWTADPGLTTELPTPAGVAINPMTTAGDMIVGGPAGVETRLPAGTSGQVLNIDSVTGLPAWVADTDAGFAVPAIVFGTAAAAGVASTVIRSDATIVAFDATVPVTQALGDTAATGSAAVAARRDHKHAVSATATTLVTFNLGSSYVYDNTVAAAQAIFGRALKTGLAAGNSQAVLHVSAGAVANDASTDFNVGAFVENFTANGAGLVIANNAKGDGLYLQTVGTTGDGVTAGQTSWGLNVSAGNSTNTTATGDAVHVQRWGAGAALSIVTNGTAGSGSTRTLATDLVVTHNSGANIGYLLVTDNGGTTADSVALTRTVVTTGKFINLFQSASTYTGDALFMNMGKGGGTFSGNFLHFATNDADRLTINNNGAMTITVANGANPLLIKVGSTTSSFFNANGALSTIQSIIMNGPATTPGLSFTPTATQSVPCMSFSSNVLTAATASAGSGAVLPATVQAYLPITINGTTFKIPYYAS